MLKGDLTSTPLAPLLLELAEDSATGCLNITDSVGEEALVFFKAGLVYSVSVPGTRPQLGAKLVSSGALAPEALAEALEAQRTELQGWRLGELLVHLGYVDQPVVEAFVKEQVSEALWDLLRWSDAHWKFRKNVKAREDVGPPMVVFELLETLRERGYEWETISAVVHGPAAVPRLSTRGDTSNETTLDNDAWSMLCKIDGERSVADLARDCGYTLFEAGHVIVSLVQAGLVDIDEDIDIDSTELYGATTLSSALAGELDDADDIADAPVEEDAMSKLARVVTEIAGDSAAAAGTAAPAPGSEQAPDEAVAAATAPAQRTAGSYENSMLVSVKGHTQESFAASIARVSSALSDVLGEAPPPIDVDELHARRRTTSTDDPEWQRRRRLRTAAAAELATAQALIESLRPDHDGVVPASPDYAGDVPKVVSRETERKRAVARDAEEAERHAAEEAARVAAQQFARAAAEEAERHAAEQEAARVAAEQAAYEAEQAAQEAERIAAEQAAQEQAAAAEQVAQEHAAAAEAAELERQEAEAAALAAEAAAAEELAWAEYWHREEAERVAAEQAAAAEAERLAAEAAERAAEAERAAAEQAQAEADRLAAEAAERLAAEEAAAAQAEADRLAAEEAERVAAEEAAAAKAERAARRKAEKLEAQEAARREDEAAAAAALLTEFAASEAAAAPPEPEPVPAEVPEPAEVEAEVLEPVGAGAPYAGDADTTDTAALLRELSSLGTDDQRDTGGPTPPRAPRAHTGPDKKAKKKIGLFGL